MYVIGTSDTYNMKFNGDSINSILITKVFESVRLVHLTLNDMISYVNTGS
jgi:hypothetical protein